MQDIIERLSPLEKRVLPVLRENISIEEIEAETKLSETEVLRALQFLENKGLVRISSSSREIIEIDDNGKIYAKNGLPERQFINALNGKTLTLNEIKTKTKLTDEEIGVSLGILKDKEAIDVVKGKEIRVKLNENGEKLLDREMAEEILLKKASQEAIFADSLNAIEKNAFESLRKRKKIIKTDLVKERSISLTEEGKRASKLKISGDYIESLNSRILKSRSWRGKKFRKYDIKINVPKIYPAKRHFVNQASEHIRRIWLDLGFKEMTGNIIQTGFWNFDALFVPQDHPARDLQDTLFIGKSGKLPKEYPKIKSVHEKEWKYRWNPKEAEKLLLRTHTTVLSAQTIAKLKESELPAKFFAIGKVFRNETVDWKHGFEFTQVEGIVVDPNANFRHLLGYLREYYNKLGFKKIRFRPSHFPYTEPSLEVEVFHPERKEWIELGGAGIFRPEVVKPLLGRDIPVLAWGQGMERGIVDYFAIKDFRDLYNNNLKQLRGMKIWLK